jgi:hypothetical protein
MRRAACILLALVMTGCGDGPTKPGPVVDPPPPPPVNNTAPTITSITVQGSRRNQPANFADLSETIAVTAAVTDAETAVEQLQYTWSATLGTFTGNGARVSWVAPAAAATPASVTITLDLVERFGNNQENKVTRTATVALHDSTKEVGDMSVRFLTEFSKPQTNRDWRDVMRDFKASACPDPGEVELERADVENHYNNFFMHNYEIDPPRVTTDFGGSCIEGVKGDACVSIGVMWESTNLANNIRARTKGTDYLTAVFAAGENRWWLCSSRFRAPATLGHPFYVR